MTSADRQLYIDLGYRQCSRRGESICGDSVMFRQLDGERFLFVLSDGLGHGVKANILATMTASMALRFIAENKNIVQSAGIIMDALPVCRVRKISYATFTIVDSRADDGQTRVIEMGNPECMLFRRAGEQKLPSRQIAAPRHPDRAMSVYNFTAEAGDRLIALSDGITQAGLGTPGKPTGWGRDGCLARIGAILADQPEISAHELSGRIMQEAIALEKNHAAADDMTAAVIHYRHPRKLLLFTGPPYDSGRDAECAARLKNFTGTRVICGGTSAEIIAREWKKELTPDFASVGGELPPMSKLEGADLVTEGIFTLPVAAKYLEQRSDAGHNDPAAKLARLLQEHDIIDFLVGTRINEAHQDPNLPIELELRRNIVKRIAAVLREKYLKEVNIQFV